MKERIYLNCEDGGPQYNDSHEI